MGYKKDSEILRHTISVRFNEEEYSLLSTMAEKEGIRVARVIREIIQKNLQGKKMIKIRWFVGKGNSGVHFEISSQDEENSFPRWLPTEAEMKRLAEQFYPDAQFQELGDYESQLIIERWEEDE